MTFGNCQAEALAFLLRRGLPEASYSVSYYANNDVLGNLRPEQEILEAVRKADLLVFQPLDDTRHRPLTEDGRGSY